MSFNPGIINSADVIAQATEAARGVATALNVKTYGALGTSTGFGNGPDDRAALQASFTAGAGRTVFIPKGMYRCPTGLTLPENTTLVMDPEAVLMLDSQTPTSILMDVNKDCTITGGELRGRFLCATGDGQPTTINGIPTLLNYIGNHKLLRIKGSSDTSATVDADNILIHRLKIHGSHQTGIDATGVLTGLTISKCHFQDNWQNLNLTNLTSLGDRLLSNITIIDNHFGKTAMAHPDVSPDYGGIIGNSNYPSGGNSLTIYGGVRHLVLDNNYFDECGRRTCEFLPGDASKNPALSFEAQKLGMVFNSVISNNYMEQAQARTFTVAVGDSAIYGNTIIDNLHSMEAGFYNTTFTNNSVFALSALDHYQPLGALSDPAKAGTVNVMQGSRVIVDNNYFEIAGSYSTSAPPSGSGYVASLINCWGGRYTNNNILIKAFGWETFRLRGCSDVVIADNTITFDTGVTASISALSVTNSRGIKFTDNKINTTKRSIGAFRSNVVNIQAGVYDITIDGNTFDDRSVNRLGVAAGSTNIIGVGVNAASALSDWSRRTFSADGLTWTDTALAGTPGTPPVTPVNNGVYYIPTHPMPTGLWATKGGQFASWIAGAWVYKTPQPGALWRPFVDANTVLKTEDAFSTNYRPFQQYADEAEFDNFPQDNNVYLIGPTVSRVRVSDNRFINNVHNASEPSRMFSSIKIGSSNSTLVVVEDLSVTGNSNLPLINSGPTSFVGYQDYSVSHPLSSVGAIMSQVRTPGARVSVEAVAIGDPTDYIASSDGSQWLPLNSVGAVNLVNVGTLPPAAASLRGRVLILHGAAGASDVAYVCIKNASDAYVWMPLN